MAGRGMGVAARGGGCVGSGPKNKMLSEPSMKTGKVVKAAMGGEINQHKAMAMGMMHGGEPMRMRGGGMPMRMRGGGMPMRMRGGGMPMRMRGGGMPMPMPMRGGGMSKKKKVKKFRDGGSCG